MTGPSPPVPLSNRSRGGLAALAARRDNLTGGWSGLPQRSPTVAGLYMTLGILSNVVALVILVKAYYRVHRRSKATFLLLASSLVATDLAGHVVAGALVLRLYLHEAGLDSTDSTCSFLGACMVFFGLCPLFLGCSMAVERCLGVTRPLLHASLVSTTRTKLCLSGILLAALCMALMPIFSLGSYTYQYPGTWCFISVLNNVGPQDLAFVLLFSGLGLASLAVAFVCNTISGLTLVWARLRRKPCGCRSTKSHDIEMVVQLVGIMVTSCICWSPLLIFGLMSAIRSHNQSLGEDLEKYRYLMMKGVYLAALNQILDPWVYILLRRAVLRKICLVTNQPANLRENTSHRWGVSSFRGLEKFSLKRTWEQHAAQGLRGGSPLWQG
uniref:Thromboxane A2 receptor n=1 Tax=Paramormyrops kingsleyae TaxID=1676925 RepID=A0A3B3RZ99_9TELE|nr:prostaglandin E2 receptor EP1 subtype-like [Paramormyrops kingsleyae]